MAGTTPKAILAIARTLRVYARSKDFQSALGMSAPASSGRTTGQRAGPKKRRRAAIATAAT